MPYILMYSVFALEGDNETGRKHEEVKENE